MTEIIELANRVIEISVTPKGKDRHTLMVQQLSGAPMTPREWRRLARTVKRKVA